MTGTATPGTSKSPVARKATLDMGGSARSAFLARMASPEGRDMPLPRFPLPLAPPAAPEVAMPHPALAELAEGPALVQLAHELARLCPPGPDREVLFALALGLLAFAQEGSTSLPLHLEGLAMWRAKLTALGTTEDTLGRVLGVLEGAPLPPALQPFVGARGHEPIALTRDAVALHRFARLEQRLADALAGQLRRPPLALDATAARQAFEEVGRAAPLRWTEDQQWALLNALHLPFTVVSGGPGTGKTTLVVSLLRLVARLGVDPSRIALAAPTGKAANRMFEEVRKQLRGEPADVDQALFLRLPEPRTLHRLLSYSPGRDRFGAHEVNPLDFDLVIVDEASMIDLFLMERLLRACSAGESGETPGRRLVLLGDANQLPSVEAGMVLHHLAAPTPPLHRPWHAWVLPGGKPSSSVPTRAASDPRAGYLTTLTYSHRMDPARPAGKAIYACAEALREGRAAALQPGAPLAIPEVADPAALAFSHVEHVPLVPGAGAYDALFEVYWRRRMERRVEVGGASLALPDLWGRTWRFAGSEVHPDDEPSLRALLLAVDAQRVLCLTRGDAPEGARRANAWFSRKRRSLEREGARARFLPGEPVIFTVNDYALKLFNGYSGVIARVSTDGEPSRLRAIFDQPRGLMAYDLEALGDRLEPAYALTVHKAQGSQVECALLLLPGDAASPLLVRQLVYTAVSRASESVLLAGPLERLVEAATRPVRRESRVMDRVMASLGPGANPA